MGGIGSGRWCRGPNMPGERKTLVKELAAYHIGDLQRAGVLEEGASGWLHQWRGNGPDPGFIEFSYRSGRLRLQFETDAPHRSTETVVEVLRTPCHFGGSRPWFACPGDSCGRRVGILYVTGGQLGCRNCWNLAYPSQHRRELQRLYDKVGRLRAKFGQWSEFSDSFPERPKSMHRRTYDALCTEVAKTETQIKDLREEELRRIMSRLLGYQCGEELSLEEHWENVRRR